MNTTQQLAEALRRVAAWDECDPTFRADYGSNGERDYYRKIAREALAAYEESTRQENVSKSSDGIDMPKMPQQAAPVEPNPLDRRCYVVSESHLGGYRLILGYETLDAVVAAHEFIVKHSAAAPKPEPVAPCAVPESAVQELCTLLEREQGVYLTHTTVSKYLSTVLKAAPKPLTDLQIADAIDARQSWVMQNDIDESFSMTVARAIEAAHGIKEQA